jgi:hypothetical protein
MKFIISPSITLIWSDGKEEEEGRLSGLEDGRRGKEVGIFREK